MSNINLDSIDNGVVNQKNDEISFISKHKKREEEKAGTLHKIIVFSIRTTGKLLILLWSILLIGITIGIFVYFWHLLTPSEWQWLEEKQIDRVQLITVSITLAFIVNIASQISYKYLNKTEK